MPRSHNRALIRALIYRLLFFGSALAGLAASDSKVDPRVWQDCDTSGTACFLVLLNEQSDTNVAVNPQADRISKRRGVVNGLRETALRCQTGVLETARRAGVNARSYWLVNAIAVEGNRDLVAALSQRDDVKTIETDRKFLLPVPPPEPATLVAAPESLTAVEPNLSRINAPALWALGFTGQGIVYGDADSGVQWDHPALKQHYRGWNGTTADHNFNWWDAVHADINGDGTNPIGFNSRVPADDDRHGTHTMGIGVGDDGSGNQIGVAPGAKWICCRNMDQGVGRPSTYLECMQFMLAPTDLNGNNPDPDRGADTVGNSYGCPTDELCAPNTLHTMLINMRSAGVFMAAAAGNEGPNCSTITYPPALDAAAITVGATDNSDAIAFFSSRGPITIDGSNRRKPDLVAPGVAVRSSVPGNAYAVLNGTSMAAPHISGAVALLWSAFPHIRGNVDYTQSILEQSAVHLTSTQVCGTNNGVPNNVFGFGRIDLLAAYNAVNRPPVASNLLVATAEDGMASPKLSGSDPEGAPLTFQIVDSPTNGLISAFSSAAGTFTYTPAHAFVGLDSLTFRVSDGLFFSTNGTVRFNVRQRVDTDQDGIPDYWEMANSLNSTNASDAAMDPDHDGRSNFQEYVANTDPQQSNSIFRIVSAMRSSTGQNVITWTSTGGTRYRVQFLDRTAAQGWNFVDVPRSVGVEMDSHASASPNTMTFVDDFSLTAAPAPGTSRYYRIRIVR